jgi:uncharacterized membrane protein
MLSYMMTFAAFIKRSEPSLTGWQSRPPQAKPNFLVHRRAIIGLSLVGMGSMAAVSLLQTGIIDHLPDPPLPGFNSDKVNLSDTAFPFGIPDGVISLISLAANIPLAIAGGADRAHKRPWLPLLFAGKAAVESAVAGWYFYQMPAKEKAWCGYCITGALANFGIFMLALPEARAALAVLRNRA